MYAEAENPDAALQFLEALWRETQERAVREKLEERAKEVMIERDIRLLESAVQQYKSTRTFPKKLQDLVTSGVLLRYLKSHSVGRTKWIPEPEKSQAQPILIGSKCSGWTSRVLHSWA